MTYNAERCQAFIAALSSPTGIPDVGTVLATVSTLGLTVADFWELDERPGAFDGNYRRNGWHIGLRVTRNADFGPNDLWDRLTANNARSA